MLSLLLREDEVVVNHVGLRQCCDECHVLALGHRHQLDHWGSKPPSQKKGQLAEEGAKQKGRSPPPGFEPGSSA